MSTAARTPLPNDVRRVVRLCGAALLLDTTFFAVLSPLLSGYADSAGLSQAGIGLLVAAYPLGFVLVAFPAGNLVSRRGPRTMLMIGLVTVALACALFAVATTGPELIAFRFLQGVGGMLAWASAMGWAQAVAPAERRGEIAGAVLGTAVVGSIAGPVIGALATVVGTAPVFLGLALVFLVLAALAVRLPATQPVASPGWRHAIGLLGDHRLRLGIWLLTLGGIVTGAIYTLAPLTLGDVGVSPVGTSAVFLVMAAAAAFTSPRVGRRADRHGRAVVAIVVLLVGAVALLVTGLVSRAGGPLWLLVLMLVAGFVVLEAGYVPGSALIADGTAQREASRGELLALANLGWALGMTFASLLAGVLVTHLGPVVPYSVVALCALLTVPEFVMIERRTRRS
jgi:MFS family permease